MYLCVCTCVCISNKVCVYILSATVCLYFIFQLMNVCMCAYSSVCETKRQKVTLNRSRSEKDRETEWDATSIDARSRWCQDQVECSNRWISSIWKGPKQFKFRLSRFCSHPLKNVLAQKAAEKRCDGLNQPMQREKTFLSILSQQC